MAKGKVRNSSSGESARQPSSLRSRKRECPSKAKSEVDNALGTSNDQDIEMNNKVDDTTVLQFPQFSLQDSFETLTEPPQTAERSTKQESATEDKHTEPPINVSLKNATRKVNEGQEETIFTNPRNDSQLECFKVLIGNDGIHSGKEKEEISVQEYNRSPSQTCTERLQVLAPISEKCNGTCSTALEEKLGAKEKSLSYFERNQETCHEERNNVFMDDVKEVIQEAVVELPAKKKRRMGMCGLSEKERSNFLQRTEKQICNNNTADFVAQEDIAASSSLPCLPFTPAGCVLDKHGAADRTEHAVSIAVITSTGNCTDQGCSEGKSNKAEGNTGFGPERTGETKSGAHTEEELLRKQQDSQCCTAESIAENHQQQKQDGVDGSAGVDLNPAISFYSNPLQNKETENQNAEAIPVQVNSMTRTKDEEMEEWTFDVGVRDTATAGASSSDTEATSCVPEELHQAAVSSAGSERKNSNDPDEKPCPSTPEPEHPQTRDTLDPFGSGYLDYVSDSQLNTITLMEEEFIKRDENLGLSDCHDATDLIRGLIRELSSLNRKVMASHRELENLRRTSKSPRSSSR